MAPASTPPRLPRYERPGFINDGAVLAAVNAAFRAAYGGGLRPTARGAFEKVGRGGETPFSRTKKLFAARCDTKGEALNGFRAG